MTEEYIAKKGMTVSEIFDVSFKVLKENWATYIIASLVIGLLVGVFGMLEYVFEGNTILKIILSIVNGLGVAAISVLYIVTTYNSIRKDKRNAGEQITSKIFRIVLTQVLLGLILLIPCLILVFGFVQMLIHTGAYSDGVFGFTSAMMLIVLIPASLWLTLKCSFMIQSIVLDDIYYLGAIKRTFTKTSGLTIKIFAIKLVQFMLMGIGFQIGSSNLFDGLVSMIVSLLVLTIMSAILNAVISIAVTVLYVNEVMAAEPADMTYILDGGF